MTTSPFDIAKHISEKTDLDFSISEYSPWMINRIFSNTMDTVFFANEMNEYYELDKDIQYSFYYNGIPKAKRFGKWNKKEKNTDLELLAKYFCINIKHAERYLSILSAEQLSIIKNKMLRGGK
jgi:hypothetical protein